MVTPRRHHVVRWPAAGLALAGALQYVPSTVALGQWGSMEALPGGWCRWRGPATSKGVALTFDDGPDPATTPHVLDSWTSSGLPPPSSAWASGWAATATWWPRSGPGVTRWPATATATSTTWPARRGGSWPTCTRPRGHGGCLGPHLLVPTHLRPGHRHHLVAARRQGWQTVLWSAWGREWATDDPAEVAARVGRGLVGGAVVLLHDTDASGRPGMCAGGLGALGPIAETLERRGLVAGRWTTCCRRPVQSWSDLTSRNSSKPNWPRSRPMPDCL